MRRRAIAAALELVPLLVFVSGGESVWTLAFALAAGLGWWFLGRWDIGVFVWIARFCLFVVAAVVDGLIGLGISDCQHCATWPEDLLFGAFIAVYALPLLASAFCAARSPARL